VSAGDVLRRAGVVTGVAAGLAGAAYGAQRAVAARMRHRDDPDAVSPLEPAFDEVISVPGHDGCALHVISRGEGPPVLFAHGVTLTSRVWAKQFDSFPAAGFRAVAFDSRGHGQSTVGDTGHSIDNLADDMKSVLEHLDLRDVVLVGHSMGGMAVQAFVLRHPLVTRARVRGIVLMSTMARIHALGGRNLRGGLERATAVVPSAGVLLRQRNVGFLLSRVGFGDDPHASHVEATRQMLASCSRETLRDAISALLEFDVTGDLPAISVPTLVLAGTSDALTPPGDAREIAALVPGARLEEFPGAGHMLMYERTAEVDKAIMEFARECAV
jgi:pimeloyl-ACP methyl ester carboxylesterase